MHPAFEVFIKKSFRSAWSPFMYSSLLAAFWGTRDLFGDKSPIYLQFLGPAKMLIGVTEAGWDLLCVVVCGCVWLCVAVCRCVWLCVVMCGAVWLCRSGGRLAPMPVFNLSGLGL